MPITIVRDPDNPPGDVTVSLASADPSIVQVLTPTVLIPTGQNSANGDVLGANFGTTTVTAMNPIFAGDISQVSVTSSI